MTDLIDLLKKPKQWVEECQKHLTELGYTEPYNYDRFINEEIGELVNNCIECKHKDNRALLIDDLCDSIWTVAAKLGGFSPESVAQYQHDIDWAIISDTDVLIYRITAYWMAYQRKQNDFYLIVILFTLINICELESVDFMSALSALVAENYSKLEFPIERRAEIFRTGKIQKKDVDGNFYPWFKPANFGVF